MLWVPFNPFVGIQIQADSASENPFLLPRRLQVIGDMETTVHLLRQSRYHHSQADVAESSMLSPTSKKSKRSKKLKKEEGDELRKHLFSGSRFRRRCWSVYARAETLYH